MIGYLLLRDHNDYNLIPLARPGDDQPEPQRIPADALHRLLGLTLSAGCLLYTSPSPRDA